MKIVTSKRVRLEDVNSVKFGSIIRLHERPDYWPAYKHTTTRIDRIEFMLTGEYYGKIQSDGDGKRELLIVSMNTGQGVGIKQNTKVEVIHERGEIMKIVKGPCCGAKELHSVKEGQTLRFINNLASKHEPNDVFIRNEICSSYRPRTTSGIESCPGKIAVTNLRTGALAYVERTRAVEVVKAEVCLP